MKNIEMIWATKSTSPTRTKAKAIPAVRIVAGTGSWLLGSIRAKSWFAAGEGNTPSRAMAWRVRGAAR